MTDKLKCPFCGYKLNESYDSDENIVGYFCANPHCRIKADVLEPYVWQALIDGKKAQAALKEIKQTLDECFSSDKSGFTVFWDVIARRVHSVITHSTKQEK